MTREGNKFAKAKNKIKISEQRQSSQSKFNERCPDLFGADVLFWRIHNFLIVVKKEK